MFLVNGLCHQTAVRPHHKAPQLGVDSHISHACRSEHFFINSAHPFSNHTDIVRCFFRSVGNAHTAGQINEADLCPGFFFQTHRQFKEALCQHRIIFICHCVAGQESMNTKFFHSLAFQNPESLKNLRFRHAVLGLSRIVHDSVANLKNSARIIAAAHTLRQCTNGFFQVRNVGNVI